MKPSGVSYVQAKLMDKSYKDLMELMEKHLKSPSSKLKYRYELFMVS